jgi:ATP-binding cassette, subfamily B, bacterial HlyB/CyaB
MNDQQTLIQSDIQIFLEHIAPFDRLSPEELQFWIAKMKPLRFRMGQKILINTQLPDRVLVIFSGKVRLVGIEPNTNKPRSLQILESGASLGWISLLRDIPCETALASEETICFVLPAADFHDLLHQHPAVAAVFATPHRSEIFDLIARYFQHQNLVLPKGRALSQLSERVWQDAIIAHELPDSLTTERFWFDSRATANLGIPLRLDSRSNGITTPHTPHPQRLIGLSANLLNVAEAIDDTWAETAATSAVLVEYAPELDFQITNTDFTVPPSQLAVAYSDGKYICKNIYIF